MSKSACNYYRDRDGFCHLINRCWSGKPCPKTQRQADKFRGALIESMLCAAIAKKQPFYAASQSPQDRFQDKP